MVKQKDNGFRQIETELWLALTKADITRSCYKVMFVVIHFTLGFEQRTKASISYDTFENYTGLSRPAIKTAIKLLKAHNIIDIAEKATNRKSTIYRLNTDFDTWVGVQADLPSRVQAGLPSNDDKTYPPDVQNLPSRGKVAMSKVETTKEKRKKTLKENPPHQENVSIKSKDVDSDPFTICSRCGFPPSWGDNYLRFTPEGTPICNDCCESNQDNDSIEDTKPDGKRIPICSRCKETPTRENGIRFKEDGTPLCENCIALLEKPGNDPESSSRFMQFWETYPRHMNMNDAYKQFNEIAPSDELLETILSALRAAKDSPEWGKGRGQYIPYAHTWLKERKWLKQAKPVKVSSQGIDFPEWPGEFRDVRGSDEYENAIRDILFVLDDGKASGRPEALAGRKLEAVLRHRGLTNTDLDYIEQWFTTQRLLKNAEINPHEVPF
ncbi:replication protein [Chloroflexota bacterium]